MFRGNNKTKLFAYIAQQEQVQYLFLNSLTDVTQAKCCRFVLCKLILSFFVLISENFKIESVQV